ncbi:MAG: anthranilate phosphoribosyltransferase [Candidatus Omnitrophota bacterium]
MNIKEAIKKIVCRDDLTEKDAYMVFDRIMSGEAGDAQISAFITALRMKGETVEEITGAVKVMRKKALKIKIGGKQTLIDTCGTGGTGIDTFNISTCAAFVLAACGARVVKHGNRAASSHCGSADVLEALGVKIDVPVAVTEECIEKINIGFLFAPFFHSAMKYAAPVRTQIGIRTIFNILGPLSNPAFSCAQKGTACQVIGVYDGCLTEVMAKVLKRLGAKHAFIVHGSDGLDEVTITGETMVSELKDGKIKSYVVTPAVFGIKKAPLKSIKGGSSKENAKIIQDILRGEKGAKRDIVLMNAAMALVAAGGAEDFKKAAAIAASAIDSGRALEKLQRLIEMTNRK